MTKQNQKMIEDIVHYAFDKYGADQMADLHLELDGMPDNPIFELITLKLAEIRPDLFDNSMTDKELSFETGYNGDL